MSKLLSFYRWAVARFAGGISQRHFALSLLAAVSAGFLGGVAAECGDTSRAAGQSIGYCSHLRTLTDTLATGGLLKIICVDSFRSRGDISSVAKQMLDQYLVLGSQHSGFLSTNPAELPTFIYSLPMSSPKSGYQPLGSGSSIQKIIDTCTLELESSLCEAAEADQ